MRTSHKWAAKSALGSAIVVALAATGSPAFAVANHGPIDHPGVVLAAAGSDTTDEFMARYLGTGTGDHNIAARPTGPLSVPGDAHCAARTYNAAPVPAGQALAPQGSISAIAALSANDGCLDIARSAQGPRPTETEGLNFWAYGMDYIAWATPSLQAPASITVQQLRDIYRCVATADDWAEVGGVAGPIRPYLPPANSAVADVFVREVLGPTATLGSCVKRTAVANSGRDAAITGADHQGVILPYAASQWIFQDINKANPALDARNGLRLGGLRNVCGKTSVTTGAVYNGSIRRWLPAAPQFSSTGVITETNAFTNLSSDGSGCGVTFVANVTKVGGPSQAAAEQHVGAGSELCTGAAASLMAGFGLVALPNGPGIPAGVGVGTCRLYGT